MFNHGPVPSMEPRFAEVVRKMAQTGQYLMPIKNGIPYVEYPPLYAWLGLAGEFSGLATPAAVRYLPRPSKTPKYPLMPAPAPPYFELVLSVKAEKEMNLYRVLPGAAELPVPDTPTPPPVHWRDKRFDTD